MLVELLVTNVPPHIGPFEFPTVSPAGSVSVKPTPVSDAGFPVGFVIVKLKLVVPFGEMVAGLKAFASAGGATTFTLAVATAPLPPSVEVMFPVVLF